LKGDAPIESLLFSTFIVHTRVLTFFDRRVRHATELKQKTVHKWNKKTEQQSSPDLHAETKTNGGEKVFGRDSHVERRLLRLERGRPKVVSQAKVTWNKKEHA